MNIQSSLAALSLLVCFSSYAVEARFNMEESIVKAQKKFHSYQSDPFGVLKGIQSGEYQQIYIQYHQCVWSEFENDGDDAGCNGGEGDSWYMGNTQCYRANAAYSLYGVKAGDDVPAHACRKQYYINSFFTKNGMQDLGSLLGLENYGDATSQCTMTDNANDDQENEENENSFQHNVQLYPNAQSSTTYCASGKFVTAMSTGAYCTGTGDLQLIDTLSDLNIELGSVNCALAFSADNSNENENNNEDENQDERRLEGEEDGEDEDEQADEEKTIWDVLSYSSACSIVAYPKDCPDPYGVKRKYDLNPRTRKRFWKSMYGIDWLSLVLFLCGSFLMFLTWFIKNREENKKKRKVFSFGRGRGRSRSPPLIRGRSKSPARGRSKSPARGRSKSPARGRSKSPAQGGRARSPDTVDSFGLKVGGKKKKGIKGFFSRKK